MNALIVVPTLNEQAHIGDVIDALLQGTDSESVSLVVVDGGSTDDTTKEVELAMSRHRGRVTLMHNPKRIQSAAVNLAVSAASPEVDVVIRADAHAGYSPGWVNRLLSTWEDKRHEGAVSVVVPMRTVGRGVVQKSIAAAQNSKLGNGGSLHRRAGVESQWVDHGHHALFSRVAFEAVGGYDETMPTNEDAEMDSRLVAAGGRIFLDASSIIDYYPRATFSGLAKQYYAYGRGRCITWRRHGSTLKLRQVLPVVVTKAFAAGLLAVPLTALVSPWFAALALPAFGYLALCTLLAAKDAKSQSRPEVLLSAVPAVIMHAAWGSGFLKELLFGARNAKI